jgi:hypothetical protein
MGSPRSISLKSLAARVLNSDHTNLDRAGKPPTIRQPDVPTSHFPERGTVGHQVNTSTNTMEPSLKYLSAGAPKLEPPLSGAQSSVPSSHSLGTGTAGHAKRNLASDRWGAEDWRVFFDERAGIAEYDGGVSRAEAEARAFEWCIIEWMERNPEPSPPDRCAWCGQLDLGGTSVVPFGAQSHGPTWLHSECWEAWFTDRRGRAEHALRDCGIERPDNKR